MSFLKRFSICLIVVFVAALSFPPSPVHAQSVTITPVEAHGYENVVEEGDVLIVLAYILPLASWQNTTYLNDATCDNAQDVIDPCYTSLISGVATQVFRDSGGLIIGSRDLPRIWYGMSGNYFCAPDSDACAIAPPVSLSFGDTSSLACILGPSSISPQPEACLTVQWHTTSTVEETAAILPDVIVPMIQNIQTGMALPPRTLINAQLITQTGAIFAQEAFPWMPVVAPDMFTVAVSKATPNFNPPTPGPNSIGAQQQEAQSTGVFQSFDGFGLAGNVVAVMLSLILMMIVFVYFIIIFRNDVPDKGLAGASGAFLMCLVCVRLGWWPVAAFFMVMAIMILLGAFNIIREWLTD